MTTDEAPRTVGTSPKEGQFTLEQVALLLQAHADAMMGIYVKYKTQFPTLAEAWRQNSYSLAAAAAAVRHSQNYSMVVVHESLKEQQNDQ